jgi:photosystem II stability/assembly factor-like uncharacterized protein
MQITVYQRYSKKVKSAAFILLLCLAISLAEIAPAAGLGTPAALAPTPVSEIVIEEPSLTPPSQGVCESGWYPISNDRGHNAYLALNTNTSSQSTQSGEWQPDLPLPGMYRVEAYIPAHPSIDWPCPPTKHISWDTSVASYTIHHKFGQTTVKGSQKELNNQWLNLGNFSFEAGTAGSVVLTDVTGEITQTTTVSFSAMRFTWLGPIPYIYLPEVFNTDTTVDLTSIWTADPGGGVKVAFNPNQDIRFYASGENHNASQVPAQITWHQSDECGGSRVISDTVSLPTGAWTQFYTSTLPDCLGVYTSTVQLEYRERTTALATNFVVNYPSAVATSPHPAFDKCNVPTIDEMNSWWHNSPYYAANFYLGGISRYCANAELDAFWVGAVSKQGWALIPTWVGPQAPCTTFLHRVSSNPAKAYLEGRLEADAASAAAARLGLASSRVIYYDVEGYYGASQDCRNTMSTFIQGWVERLHELGAQAGVYGSCNSYISDWSTLDPIPDNVWIASWNKKSYDSTATVWGISCLDDALWANHQRIRQYTGGHVETWGGVSLSIDSNASDGTVVVIPQPLPPTTTLSSASEEITPSVEGHVKDFQLLSPDQGWTLVNDRLYWTQDGGLTWSDRTPNSGNGQEILSAFFLNLSQGWAVAREAGSGSVRLLRTQDGGLSWEASSLGELPVGPGAAIPAVHLTFIDANDGWAAFVLPSSSNFSLGMLFATRDGGQTWVQRTLPIGAPVYFVDSLHGWTAGGVNGDELYRTSDGGETWVSQRISPPGNPASGMSVGLPEFQDGENGQLPVVFSSPEGQTLAIYTTQDGGQSWSMTSTAILPKEPQVGPARLVKSGGSLLLFAPGTGSFYSTAGSRLVENEPSGWGGVAPGKSALQSPDLVDPLSGASAIDFVTAQNGWAQVESGSCSGEKVKPGADSNPSDSPFTCQGYSRLISTRDGGRSWVEITPPAAAGLP